MRSVRAEDLHTYLEVFHATYREKLDKYVPTEYQNQLFRARHLEGAQICGYVSTTHGLGYEYRPSKTNDIDVSYGSARADEFLFDCPRGTVQTPGKVAVHLTAQGFCMINCRVEGRIPIFLDGYEASATVVELEWKFKGRSGQLAFAQLFANRNADFWSREKAVERAMEEVLEASLGVQAMESLRLSLGDFLERFKKGHVLILGAFDDAGMARIEAIRKVLGESGYYGVTLQEIKEVAEYDLRQKLTAVASVCRFVVVDDSSKAGQLSEIPIIEFLRVPVVILRLKGTASSYVVQPLDATSKVAREVEYDAGSLSTVLQQSINWAESTIGDLRTKYSRVYPWRSTDDGPTIC